MPGRRGGHVEVAAVFADRPVVVAIAKEVVGESQGEARVVGVGFFVGVVIDCGSGSTVDVGIAGGGRWSSRGQRWWLYRLGRKDRTAGLGGETDDERRDKRDHGCSGGVTSSVLKFEKRRGISGVGCGKPLKRPGTQNS